MLKDIGSLAIGDHFIERCGCIYLVTADLEGPPSWRRPVAVVKISCGRYRPGYTASFDPEVLVDVDPLRLALALEM